MRAALCLLALCLLGGDVASSGIMPNEDDLSDDDLRQFFEGMLGLSDDQAKAAEERMGAGMDPVPDTEVERLMAHIAQRPHEEDPVTADAAAPAPEKAGDADMSEEEATGVLSSIFSDLITTVVKPAADAEAQPEQAHKPTQEARRAALQRAQEEQDDNDMADFAIKGVTAAVAAMAAPVLVEAVEDVMFPAEDQQHQDAPAHPYQAQNQDDPVGSVVEELSKLFEEQTRPALEDQGMEPAAAAPVHGRQLIPMFATAPPLSALTPEQPFELTVEAPEFYSRMPPVMDLSRMPQAMEMPPMPQRLEMNDDYESVLPFLAPRMSQLPQFEFEAEAGPMPFVQQQQLFAPQPFFVPPAMPETRSELDMIHPNMAMIHQLVHAPESHSSIPADHQPMMLHLDDKDQFYIVSGWFPGVNKEDFKLTLNGDILHVTARITDQSDPGLRRGPTPWSDVSDVDEDMQLPYAPSGKLLKAHFDPVRHTFVAVFPMEESVEIELQ